MMTKADIESLAIQFLDRLFLNLNAREIDIKNWEIDHLCYRTSSQENYVQAKNRFSQLGSLLIESEVNGRLIATYKLTKPIFYKKWIIDLVEVPAPKTNKITAEGFEHLEVVVDESFQSIIDRYPEIEFNNKGLAKDFNPELEIEFKDCAIKFHHKSLEHVINIEKDSRVMNFLSDYQFLSGLKIYSPCISGTLPLNIQNSKSDLDVLFRSNNLDQFSREVIKIFGELEGFTSKETTHQDLPSVIINFNYQGLPIEFFCQDKDVYQQQANQHFLIEGRLLKILGPQFRQEIKELKNKGVKTEPAFGELLNLTKPYQELIELNKRSDFDLHQDIRFYQS